MGAGAIAHRVKTGRLIVVHAGVYAVEYPRPEAMARAAAAVLACGKGALLSHVSAAVLWGMLKHWPDIPEVMVPGDRRRPGIRTHRSTTLTRRDIRRHRNIAVTSPARTVLDVASRLTDAQLTRAVNDARLAGHLRRSEVMEVVTRLPSHAGAGRLRKVVQGSQARPTRSTLEDVFRQFTTRYGLPMPRVNTHVGGYEVDALFEQQRVIVELDGYEFHNDRASFENDRERDAAMLALGYVTIRITWERLAEQSSREAQRLYQILEMRREHAA